MNKTIEGLYYSRSHEWVKAEGETVSVGITDYAQKALGSVVYVDMPEVEDEVSADEEFGAVESVKAASDLVSPVSGEVVQVNNILADSPSLLNSDPYGTWIIRVRMSDPSELDSLMDSAAYSEYCEGL